MTINKSFVSNRLKIIGGIREDSEACTKAWYIVILYFGYFVIIPHRRTRLLILNLFLRVVEAIAQSRIEKIDSTQLGNVHFNHLVQTNIKFYGS